MLKTLLAALFMFSPVSVHAEDMKFRLPPDTVENRTARLIVNNGDIEIYASGDITLGTSERFIEFVRNKSVKSGVVVFDSPGGSLMEGIKLGRQIRQFGFNTAIGSYGPNGVREFNGICASACAYAFAGGEYRFFNGEKERLGIHQFYLSGDNKGDIGDTQLVSSVLVEYLSEMGVDPRAFAVASTARGDAMRWLTMSEALLLGLANNGADATTAEIKINERDGSPYLKLEQRLSNVISRVVFGCTNNQIVMTAGIVTSHDRSLAMRNNLSRNYLETSGANEIMEMPGNSGTAVIGDVLWLMRTPADEEMLALLKSDDLGIWTESEDPMRWGTVINLRPTKEKMVYFFKNCLKVK